MINNHKLVTKIISFISKLKVKTMQKRTNDCKSSIKLEGKENQIHRNPLLLKLEAMKEIEVSNAMSYGLTFSPS